MAVRRWIASAPHYTMLVNIRQSRIAVAGIAWSRAGEWFCKHFEDRDGLTGRTRASRPGVGRSKRPWSNAPRGLQANFGRVSGEDPTAVLDPPYGAASPAVHGACRIRVSIATGIRSRPTAFCVCA